MQMLRWNRALRAICATRESNEERAQPAAANNSGERRSPPCLSPHVQPKMSQDYIISKGTSLRFSPARSLDPALRNEIEEFFNDYECLKAFCLCSVKRGWFSRGINTLCLVHDNAEAYSQAHADLGRRLTAYFSAHPGFMDYMGFDWSNMEHRPFIEAFMTKIPFVKKEPTQASVPTLTVCPSLGVSLQPEPRPIIVANVTHF
jgi:hypothetical protein